MKRLFNLWRAILPAFLLAVVAAVCLPPSGNGLAAERPAGAGPASTKRHHAAGRAVSPSTASAAAADPATDAADKPTPTMPVDKVRIGMKGYGLTVFHGTEIEAFPVEVLSIVPGSSPKRSAIWIRCTDPRLEKSGPVEGMSGSPIYLWRKGQEKKLGEGGRLIGAFAFGYQYLKGCIAGVQPIAQMRGVGQRAEAQSKDNPAEQPEQSAATNGASRGTLIRSQRMLARLTRLASQTDASPIERFRLNAVNKVLRRPGGKAARAIDTLKKIPNTSGDGVSLPRGPKNEDGRVMRMLLPMAVGSPKLAKLTAPLLEPLGIAPVAGGGGTIGGSPPPSIDSNGVKLAPGSVLSIPLAYGDMDLAAVGTVTDVLPDGTVLGFGHAMFGQGPVALPMATGYVHFFVPRVNVSFKQAGSLALSGSIVEDETTAVAGVSGKRYTTAPMRIKVAAPGQPTQQYHYHLVNHPSLTPMLSVILATQSVTAAEKLPILNTLHLSGKLTFTGGHTLKLDSMLAGAQPADLLFELMPVIEALMNNQHKNLDLKSIDLSTRVEPKLRAGSLVSARLSKAVVAPGKSVRISATIQPYGEPARTEHAKLKVPRDLAEGDYPLMIVDAPTYAMLMLANRPYLATTESVDDLAELLQRILSIKRNALYVVLQRHNKSVAVGRTELPNLPSSRQAMIATPTSTLATPFVDTVHKTIPTSVVVQGQQAFTLSVRKEPSSTPAPTPAAQLPSPQKSEGSGE